MRIELIMQFDEAYAPMGVVAAKRAQQYANLHGYRCYIYREFPKEQPKNPRWAKIARMSQQIGMGCEYLFWMDADTVILNLDYELEDLMSGKGMDVSQDSNGLCAGVFGIHANQWGHDMLAAWNFLGQKFAANPIIADQATLKLLEVEFPTVREQIALIPESVVSNCECDGPGSFLHHYWANNKDPQVIAGNMIERIAREHQYAG